MNKARRFLYSIPIALVGLALLLIAFPASAANTDGTVAVSKTRVSTNVGAAAGSDTITVTVTDPDIFAPPAINNNAAVETITVNVRSTTDGVGIDLTLTETGVATNVFTDTFVVTTAPSALAGAGSSYGPDHIVGNADDVTPAPEDQLRVNNGDTVTVRYTDADGQFTDGLLITKTATVDSIAPVITSFTPATGTVFGGASLSVTLTVTATDDRAGFIPDDATTTPANEAIPNATFTVGLNAGLAATGASVDAAGALTSSFTATFGAPGSPYAWNATVRDRAGNQTVLDASTTAGQQDATFSVDNTPPVITGAITGKAMNAANDAIVSNRKGVQVTFGENLDAATIDASDFSVASATVTAAALGPNVTSGPDLRNMVFLALAADLAPDAKPQVSLVGSVRDRAGNAAAVASVNATDGIAPTLSVAVAGDVDNRPAAKSTLTVTIQSDEDLISSPNVTLGSVRLSSSNNTTADQIDIVDNAAGALAAAAVSGQTRTWSIQFTQATFGGNGLANFYVVATDKNAVNATKGVTGADVDLSKAVLGEFDAQFAAGLAGGANPAGVFILNPIVTAATDTDSTMPFVQISFAGEGTEYTVACPAGVAAPACAAAATDGSIGAGEYGANTGDAAITVDTHTGVTITSAKFGLKGQTGADVAANVQSTGKNSFIFQPGSALAVGSSYTLSVNAKDDIGNTSTVTYDFTFNVVAPKKVTLNVVPGWNVISLPDNPDKMGINDVFGANAGIVQVLTYDANDPTGPWLVSQRGTDGKFGTAQIVNIDTLHAYWVQATKFETVSVTIPRRQAGLTGNALQPPQVPVKAGWNLVGVIDTTVPAAGTIRDADAYFGTVDWGFAYTFDTATGAWARKVKSGALADAAAGTTDALLIGKGYWLYANKDGLLVP